MQREPNNKLFCLKWITILFFFCMVCNSARRRSSNFDFDHVHVNRVVRLNEIFSVHHPFDTEKERRKKKKETKKQKRQVHSPRSRLAPEKIQFFVLSYDGLYDHLASQTCSFEKFSYIPRVFEFHLVCFEKYPHSLFFWNNLVYCLLVHFISIQESLLSLISYYLAVVHSTWHLDQIKSKAFRHKP